MKSTSHRIGSSSSVGALRSRRPPIRAIERAARNLRPENPPVRACPSSTKYVLISRFFFFFFFRFTLSYKVRLSSYRIQEQVVQVGVRSLDRDKNSLSIKKGRGGGVRGVEASFPFGRRNAKNDNRLVKKFGKRTVDKRSGKGLSSTYSLGLAPRYRDNTVRGENNLTYKCTIYFDKKKSRSVKNFTTKYYNYYYVL